MHTTRKILLASTGSYESLVNHNSSAHRAASVGVRDQRAKFDIFFNLERKI